MNILLTMKRVVFKSSFQICVLCNVVSVSCDSRWCKKVCYTPLTRQWEFPT